MFARVVVAVNGIAFLGFGLVGLFSPQTLADPIGYILSTLSAYIEVRAFYGGYEIGTALFLLICAAKREWVRIGLLASVLMIGGTMGGRTLGFIVDGNPSTVMRVVLALEVVAALVSAVALRTSAAPPSAPPIVSEPIG